MAQATDLLSAVGGSPRQLVIAGDAIDEAIAFVASGLDAERGSPHSLRALVVKNNDAWRRLVGSPTTNTGNIVR